MGLLTRVLGDREDVPAETDDETNRYALLVNAGPDRFATASNGFGYAIDLDDAGNEVRVFLDGKATRWPGAFVEDPDRPFAHKWEMLLERELLVGACGYCAHAFDAAEGAEKANVELLSGNAEHAPSVAELSEMGYEIIAIG